MERPQVIDEVSADLIDEDPPADVIEVEPSPDRAPTPPSYAPLPPPNMGNVIRPASELEMGGVDAKVVFKAPEPLPPTADILALLQEQRAELVFRIAAIETLLGFVETADDLAVRVAKIERFVGI